MTIIYAKVDLTEGEPASTEALQQAFVNVMASLGGAINVLSGRCGGKPELLEMLLKNYLFSLKDAEAVAKSMGILPENYRMEENEASARKTRLVIDGDLKRLEWFEWCGSGVPIAQPHFGGDNYAIQPSRNGFKCWGEEYGSIEDAKLGTQAHFERRVLACFVGQPDYLEKSAEWDGLTPHPSISAENINDPS